MKRAVLLMLAAMLLAMTGCNSPAGAPTADTSLGEQSKGNASATASLESATPSSAISSNSTTTVPSETNSSKTTTASRVSSKAGKVSDREPAYSSKDASKESVASRYVGSQLASNLVTSREQKSVPPELQKIWDSLTDEITDEEVAAYKRVLKEYGFSTAFTKKDIIPVYTLTDKPYLALVELDKGEMIFDRASKTLSEGSEVNNVWSKFGDKRFYYSGAGGWYYKDENGDFQHIIATYDKILKKDAEAVQKHLEQYLILFYENSLKNDRKGD